MTEFWNVDKTRQILQIGTFVVEFAEAVVLATIALFERFQNVDVVRP